LLKAISRTLGGCDDLVAMSHAVAAPPSTRPLHLLLAEDNEVNQKVALKLLERLGHTVVVASTGAEAFELYCRDHFDLILMDVQMPVMNGYDATWAIRLKEHGTGRRMPVVALPPTPSRRSNRLPRCGHGRLHQQANPRPRSPGGS